MTMSSARTAPGIGRALAAMVLTVTVGAAAAGCAAAAGGTTNPSGPSSASGPRAQGTRLVRARPPAPAAVWVRDVVLKDGHVMTIARFSGGVRFVLHCGSMDPGPACQGKVKAGPSVGGAGRRLLIAAFNGGFKLGTHSGGYMQEGKVISPLVPGRASLVIYRSGKASIGIWGHGLPRPGKKVYSVRQNLDLLVRNGQPTGASVAGWSSWGATITGAENTARSALGENARGQLIYVASMTATPPDLATALVRAGAVTGMELDINPEWVQLAYASRPGGPLWAGIPGQVRPADQYLQGWTRDFIAVVALWPTFVPGSHAAPRFGP
ncbi:MAG TPA: phosphodiester glycosidase family protein [Streptosporangiaceae bacterium]